MNFDVNQPLIVRTSRTTDDDGGLDSEGRPFDRPNGLPGTPQSETSAPLAQLRRSRQRGGPGIGPGPEWFA